MIGGGPKEDPWRCCDRGGPKESRKIIGKRKGCWTPREDAWVNGTGPGGGAGWEDLILDKGLPAHLVCYSPLRSPSPNTLHATTPRGSGMGGGHRSMLYNY